MRRFGWILLPMLVLVGLRIGAMGSPAVRASGWVVDFFDDFAANTGWSVSDAPGGTVAFGHNDGGVSVLRLDQPNGGAYPLVGREGLFNSIPAGAPWAFEIRFRFPEVTAYGVGIGMGSGSWDPARVHWDLCVGSRPDWANAFTAFQDNSGNPPRLWSKVFGVQILERPAPDTAWHTIRVEVQPDGTWRAFVDGGLAGSGSGAFRPRLVSFGNHCLVQHWGNWSDLHIDYLRIEHFVDDLPPITTIALDPPSPNGDNGWYRTAVNVSITAADDASGVREIRYRLDGGPWAVYSGPFPVSADGTHTVEAYAVDNAGNVESPPKSVSFRIDATPPTISWSATPSAPDGDNGWYRAPITVTWSCADSLSGIAACPGPSLITGEGTHLTVSGTARDQAGNTASATAGPFRRDATPPAVSGAVDPPPNAYGWSRTPVTVTWTGVDTLSGVVACDPPATAATEGANQTVSGSCRDRAGNVGSAEARVSIDLAPPRITASRSPSPNAFGWVSVPVTVTFTCEDLLSGIALCPGPVAVAAEGENQSVSGTAKDRADNAASTTLSGISIDFTPPAVQGIPDRPPDHGGWYTAPFTITWSGSDALSGIRECDASIRYEGPDTASGSLSGSCVDRADNAGEATFAFRYDATPPTIAAVVSPTLPDGLSGWWVTPPVVSFACEDAASGIAFCSPPVTVTTEGLAAVAGMAEDFAGWTSTASAALKVDLSPPSAGLVMPASWCFACAGPVSIGLLMADGVSGVGSWTLRLEAHGSWRAFTGTGPAGSVVWDGQLEGATVQPGDRVTVTLVVRDAAGHEGSAQAFLAIAAPSAPPPLSPPTPASTPTPSPAPTRIRPVRTPTATPVLGETPAPEPTPTPEPTLAPTPVPAPAPPSPAPALVMGVVFLDRNGNGLQDPDEPGIPGAVVEAAGRRIVTGPDGRFWMPAGFRAKLLQLPVRGRLTVADGLRFGVQPIRSRWWLLGLALGMILLGLAWARDPRPKATRRLTEILRERRMR